ncbi:uncharacterized protein LAESUDRAFT_660285 [Laetiporus sulphureus 93-53]|uniref:F-box domain-containing protein n=1 Tax=Laetiporus sulphureus 93-53 TaxID=1314785 RepID=A0A165CQF9_9APHY|nr:uncharacterized protein LAESUDRAFT_660285 [Laetiporus sulphureus 93-53]KZT03234.1 hypothetical protein LAESUDRAFT_660285 [Laetiporus sulphureus 93-53]
MDEISPRSLSSIDDDTLIIIFSFLPVQSVLAIRQTSRRMVAISHTHAIWHSAYVREILLAGLPFPHRELAVMDASELEHCVCRAIRIGRFWLDPLAQPRDITDFQASSGTGVSKLCFLPGYGGRRIATVTKGIWSVIACWEVSLGKNPPQSASIRKVAEWCPKGMIFTGFVVNTDAHADAVAATSVTGGSEQCIEILCISDDRADDGPATIKCVRTIRTSFRPIALEGDMIAYSDDSSETRIMDLRSGALAILRSAEEPVDQRFQYNRCLQVVFAYRSILVVRARSVELFEMPVLRSNSETFSYHPLANHSFGWIDGVSVKVQACPSDVDSGPIEPLSILLRAESDDPWTSDVHTLDLYTLEPNPQYIEDLRILPVDGAQDATPPSLSIDRTIGRSPYLFPPMHSKLSSPSVRGILRCTDIILGPYGTAVWIQPRPAHSADLTTLDVHASETQAPNTAMKATETLAGAVFAGLLQRAHPDIDLRARTLWAQLPGASHWTSLDYVEELGLLAIGSSDGRVTVLELGL